MSPKDIVAGVSQLTQTKLMPTVPKKWSPQFHFGLQAYGLKAFQSATSNARQVVVNANTAARKSERLLANSKLADHFGEVFDALGLIKPASFVNIDHSDMNRLVALVGAVQTRKGQPSHVWSKPRTATIYQHKVRLDLPLERMHSGK